MPELSNREVLQPSLLDRLTDSARFIERVTISYRDAALAGAKLDVGAVQAMLESLGLRRVDEDAGAGLETWDHLPERGPFRSLLELAPRPGGPALGDLIELKRRQSVPNHQESRQQRIVSGKRLRQSVLRDLGWLLNTGQLTSTLDLDPYPEVRRSVLNYGIPDLAGATVTDADVERIAAGVRLAIEHFEPRLRQVSVVPVDETDTAHHNAVAFRIEGELWGQPVPEHLYLHTELDLESAEFSVRDSGGAG